jgi:hypothetical protein
MINRLAFFSLSLLPLTLILGIFFSELILISIILFFIIKNKNKKFFFKNNFFYILFTFYIYIVLRSFFVENIVLSLETSLFYIRFILFSLGVWFLLKKNPNLINYFYGILGIVLFVLVMDGFFQFFFEYNIIGYISPRPDRLTGFFKDEMKIGSYIIKILPLYLSLFFYFFNNKRKIVNLLNIFLILLCAILILLSGERAAIFSLFLLIFILFFSIRFSFKIKFIALLIVIFFLVLPIFLIPKLKDRIIIQTHSQIIFFEKEKNTKVFNFIYYNEIFDTSYKMFLDNVFFGQGPKQFRFLCSKEKFLSTNKDTQKNGCTTHPHNYYMQMLAETGLVGFSFIFFLFLYSVKKIVFHIFLSRHKKIFILTNSEICILSSFCISLFPFMTTGNFFNNWNSILLFLPVGFYLNKIYKFNMIK